MGVKFLLQEGSFGLMEGAWMQCDDLRQVSSDIEVELSGAQAGQLVPAPGCQFVWDIPFPYSSTEEWVRAAEAGKGSSEDLTPGALNKKYSRIVGGQRGNRPFSLPMVRRLAKQKNLTASRPIGDQSVCPDAVLQTLLGRVIDLLLLTIPDTEHFDASSPKDIFERLRALNGARRRNEKVQWSLFSLDFVKCLLYLPHDLILESWDHLLKLAKELGFSEAWVSPRRSSYKGARSAPPPSKRGSWSRTPLSGVRGMLERVLSEMYVSHRPRKKKAARIGRQCLGLTMGIGAAPALCRMVMIVAERRALLSPELAAFRRRYQGWLWSGFRFMDDARVVVSHPKGAPQDVIESAIREFTGIMWPSCMPWTRDNVNPTVGFFLFATDGVLRWFPEPKTVKADFTVRMSSANRPHLTFQHFHSWVSDSLRRGVLLGTWAKCRAQSSDDACFEYALLLYATSLVRFHGFPAEYVVQSLDGWAKRPMNHGGGLRWPTIRASVTELLASGRTSAQMVRFKAALQTGTLNSSIVSL